MILPQPAYPLRIKHNNSKVQVFDIVRKKYVAFTPEEWVRQHVLHYFIIEKKYPKGLLAVEKTIFVNNQRRRFDVVLFSKRETQPLLIVECKAYHAVIDQRVLNQAGWYNTELNARYLAVTNWRQWVVAKVDKPSGAFTFLDALPDYRKL